MPSAAPAPSPPQPSPPRAPRSRVPVSIAILLAAAWLTGLACLALWTANPPALNVGQLERSDYLVTARVIDDAAGKVRIERDWKLYPGPLDALDGEITIANWKDLRARPEGSSCLIPLIRDGERFYISLPGSADPRYVNPRTPPRIYPASPAIERQTEQAVADLRRP